MSRQMTLACIILAVVGFPAILLAETATNPTTNEAEQPSYELRLNCTELQPYQPLMGVATLRNPSDQSPLRVRTAWATYPIVRYKTQADKQWTLLKTWWLAQALIVPPWQVIEPGKYHSYGIALYTFDASGRPIFQSGKKYEIQVVMPLHHGGGALPANEQIISNTVLITCSKGPDREQTALNALVAKADTHISKSLLFELIPSTGSSEDRTEHLQRIEKYVTAYPTSLYSLYLRRSYILYVATTVGQHEKAIDAQAAAYRTYLKQHAPWLSTEPR